MFSKNYNFLLFLVKYHNSGKNVFLKVMWYLISYQMSYISFSGIIINSLNLVLALGSRNEIKDQIFIKRGMTLLWVNFFFLVKKYDFSFSFSLRLLSSFLTKKKIYSHYCHATWSTWKPNHIIKFSWKSVFFQFLLRHPQSNSVKWFSLHKFKV